MGRFWDLLPPKTKKKYTQPSLFSSSLRIFLYLSPSRTLLLFVLFSFSLAPRNSLRLSLLFQFMRNVLCIDLQFHSHPSAPIHTMNVLYNILFILRSHMYASFIDVFCVNLEKSCGSLAAESSFFSLFACKKFE